MPDQRSLAVEPARAAWRDWLAAAQRVRQLTRERAGAGEHLIASLNRWPSFVVADPWVIAVEMPAGAPAPEGHGATRRPRSSRETPAPAAARAATSLASPAAARHQTPGALLPHAQATRHTSASAARTPAEPAPALSAGARTVHNDGRPPATTNLAEPAGSTIAALVAEMIARHVPPSPAGTSVAPSAWGDLLPTRVEQVPSVEPTTALGQAALSTSRPALQAVDLPVRAALERVAQAEAPSTAATLLTPAAELLQRLLPDHTAAASTTHEPVATLPERIVAPRAPSHLLADPGRSSPVPTNRSLPAASGSTLPDTDDEAGAQAISRLLADQAWLRGVDFT